MIVVNVMGTLDRGGVETVSLELCRAIPPAEAQQIFLTTGRTVGRLAPQFRDAGGLVHRCPVRPALLFPFRLWRYFRRIQPDIVGSHISVVSGLGLGIAAMTGVEV